MACWLHWPARAPKGPSYSARRPGSTAQPRSITRCSKSAWNRSRARYGGSRRGHASNTARLAITEAFTGPSVRRLRAEQIAAGSAAATKMLRELHAQPFLAEVRPLPSFLGATPLLQRDASYREVYRMWQALRQHP